MARRSRVRYGKVFRTRKGRRGRYKYVNGRRVAFKVLSKGPRKTWSQQRRYYRRSPYNWRR